MRAEFNPGSGSIAFYLPGFPEKKILEGVAWVSYRTSKLDFHKATLLDDGCSILEDALIDVHGSGTQLVIRSPVFPHGLELTYRINHYSERPFTLVQLSIRNLGSESIHLHEFCLLQADPAAGGCVRLPDPLGELRFFKVGWHGWDFSGLRRLHDRNSDTRLDLITRASYTNPVTPRLRMRGKFSSEGWGMLSDENSVLVAGFITTARQFGQVYTSLHPGQEALRLCTQADGILLDPGESCGSEWGYLQIKSPLDAEPSADFVDAVARQMQPRIPISPPPAMWTHWYHFYHDISEELFLRNLDTLAELHSRLPIGVVELDDGYQSAWGDWSSTNEKFPHGLEWLADQMISRGFTPGLWLSPFVVERKSKVALEHPDWLVKDDRGKPISAGFQYNLFTQALDITHPAVLEYLHFLADKLCHGWGYGMLKLDFINAGALPGRRFNPKLTRAEALRLGLQALRQGAGESTFLLASGCPFGPAIGIVDAMRIGPDTAPNWTPYFHWIPWAGPLIKREPSMPSLRNAIRHTLNLSAFHQHWWWNDPDCLLVRDLDTRLSEAEVQSAVTLVGLNGGMLVSSDDLRKVSPERLRWLSLLVPNLGLNGFPLDLLERDMPVRYLARLQVASQFWQVVALFNWQDHPAECYLKFEQLGYKLDSLLHVFDFWNRKVWRTNNNNLVFPEVPAHGCRLLRICEVREAPQLVGDTLHISQGAEIASWQVDGERLRIETVDMGRYVEGELWLALDRSPGIATCNGEQVKVEDLGEGGYAFHLQFTGKANLEIFLSA